MKKIWWFIAALVAIILILYFTIVKAHAFNNNACNEGYAGDHNPHCYPTATPAQTPTPTFNPCGQKDGIQWEDDYQPCPTQSVTPTASDSATPEASPEGTESPTSAPNGGGPGDGRSDGRSDGLSSCPSCTANPNTPNKAPSTGRAEH